MREGKWLSGLGAFAVAHGVVLYGTLRRNSGWFGPLVTTFEPKGDEVWLTIDDGPTPRDTSSMLEVLAAHGARATFFFVGRNVERERQLTMRVARAGHGIGSHTYSHPAGSFWTLPPWTMDREIRLGADAIEVATGVRPTLFRSPVGMTNPCVHPVLRREGATLVGWSASGVDGLGDRGEVVVRRVMRAVRPGGIIVLHEGGAPGRVATLDLLLRELKMRGLRCVVPGMERMVYSHASTGAWEGSGQTASALRGSPQGETSGSERVNTQRRVP